MQHQVEKFNYRYALFQSKLKSLKYKFNLFRYLNPLASIQAQFAILFSKEKSIDSRRNKTKFDLQKAEELFITNVITGIQPITKYRKKEYQSTLAHKFVQKLNAKIVGS